MRDEGRVRAVVRHLMNDECVALLGPPMSEKSHLLRDVATALTAGGRFRPLHIDLWRTRSNDEAAFFTSLAGLLAAELGEQRARSRTGDRCHARSRAISLSARNASGGQRRAAHRSPAGAAARPGAQPAASRCARPTWSARPMRRTAWWRWSPAGVNLVGLSAGPTSPFNIAKPVVAAPLTEEQSRALAEATLSALGCSASANGMDRILKWGMGDRYLIPRLCADSSELVSLHRQHHVSFGNRGAGRACAHRAIRRPRRSALQSG